MSEAPGNGEQNTANKTEPGSGGIDPNAAAAAARREERLKREAVEKERDELMRRIAELEEKKTEPNFTEEIYDDPSKLEQVIEARIQRKLAEQERKFQQMTERQKAEAVAAEIRGSFKIFKDPDYAQDAEDMLLGRIRRHDGEVTPDVYKELCQDVAKRIERNKAAATNSNGGDSDDEITPPPPGGSAAGAMGVQDGQEWVGLTPAQRSKKIAEMVANRK